MELIDTNSLKINTFVAKKLANDLNVATKEVEKLYGMDIFVTYRLVAHVLEYENRQTGLNLTHSQDKNFIQVSGFADQQCCMYYSWIQFSRHICESMKNKYLSWYDLLTI